MIMLSRYIKGRIFTLFQPNNGYKQVVIDFRHLNLRIAKNNLAYPSLKDTFSVLGSSKCEVLSILDLKDAFHSLRLPEIPRNIAVYSLVLVVHHISIRGCPWD